MKEYIPYVSYGSHGIDATAFYKIFGVTITAVSKNAKVSRKSASRVAIYHASEENTGKIVWYLEKNNIEKYDIAVQLCQKEIRAALIKLEKEWKIYKKRERILDEYRLKYGIFRRIPYIEKEKIENILRRCKEL